MVETELRDESVDRRAWWGRRRLRYNAALAAAGIVAFICYASIASTVNVDRIDASENQMPEVTVTTAFQAAGYLVAMGLANVLYGLGPLIERIFRPRDVAGYRRITYSLGLWFSVALPFLIPLLVGVKVLTRH